MRPHTTVCRSKPLNIFDPRILAGTNTASPATSTALIFVFIFRQAADKSFVNLNYAPKLLNILDQGDADFVAHHPRSFVRSKTHVAHDLQCAHTFLASQHKVDHAIPIAQRFVGVFENCSGKVRKTIACGTTWSAFGALPMPLAGRQVIDGGIATARAMDTLGPTASDEICFASFLIGEHRLELGGGKLGDGLGLFPVGHDGSPSTMEGYCHA